MINKLVLIGVGLIGGSLVRGLRAAQQVREVVGVGRDEANLELARGLGVIDRYETDPGAAVADADLVVLAVPLGAMKSVMQAIAPQLADRTIVTDVGSAKGSVLADARLALGGQLKNFVPGHPIAGTEKSGVEASFAELFQQRRVILTPHDTTSAQALNVVREMWLACGAEVIEMSVAHHDEVLAATSHLPHMLAYALVDTLARMEDRQDIFDYAAGGFRDFTRIASSDPQMWHDIAMANRTALVEVMQRFRADLERLIDAIDRGDGAFVKTTFERAKQARDAFCQGK
ncbi:MAG: prephenate dehydrogenase/arogenate dehydrogenase family protein [Gammaproteobacteria bacterium]